MNCARVVPVSDIPPGMAQYVTGHKLNLGCGSTKMEGFVNADMYGEPDLKFDARKQWPVLPGSFDTVWAHHMLEHFDGNEIIDVFWEIGNALKVGGHLVAAVPYASSSHQYACPQHKTGFTEQSFHHYSKATFSQDGVSPGMDQGLRLHNWTPVEVWLVPMTEYEKADHTSADFQFAVRHFNNVIKELCFVLRKEKE
jgi:SAM-dependent methyltransferase